MMPEASKLPVIIFDDFTTSSQYVNFKFKVKSSAMKILCVNTDIVLPKYIFYRMQIIDFDHSTHKRYWIQHYSKIKVKIPALPVQEKVIQKIEESFYQLDKGVETLQTIRQQLAVYRQAVLKEAFAGNLTKKWRNSTSIENVEEIIEKIEKTHNVVGYCPMMENFDLPCIPASWKWVSIGQISTGAEYGSSKKSQKKGLMPVLRMGNIQNGEFDFSDLVYTSDTVEINKYQLHHGDVLFNRTNSPEWVGKTAVFKEDISAIFAGYLIRINQVPEVNSDYLSYYLNSSIAKGYGNKVKTDGVNQSNINSKKLYSYPFPLCSLEEQDLIVNELKSRFSFCDYLEQTVGKALAQAEALRQSILKQAFEKQ